MRTGARNSAQSEVIAVLLLIAISTASIGVISVYSAPTVLDSTEYISTQSTEKSFLRLSSGVSEISSTDVDSGTVDLELNGELLSRPDSVSVNVTQEYPSGSWDNRSLYNGTLGRIAHEDGGEEISYEGGGVFRKQRGSNSSVTVSPPSVYREPNGLGLVVHNITTDPGAVGSSLPVDIDAETERLFPNSSYSAPGEENKTNPVRNGTVYVTVETRYFDAWAEWFESMPGVSVEEVDANDGNGTVRAKLLSNETPTIRTAGVSSERYESDQDPFVNTTTGVGYPVPDGWVENASAYAVSDPTVENVTECETGCDGGVYYIDGDYTLDGTLNTNDDVTLVVDGSLTVGALDVAGNPSNTARVAAMDGITVEDMGSVDVNSDPTRLLFYSKSGSLVEINGSGDGEGVVYAPGSTVALGGMEGNWTGSFVAERFDTSGVDPDSEVSFGGPVPVSGFGSPDRVRIVERRIRIK